MSDAARPGRVVVVGSLNADLTVYTDRIPGPGETVHGHDFGVSPGGKSANQAVAAGKLGANVAMIGAVGADDHGRMLLASLHNAGVDTAAVHELDDVETGVALITVDAHGENNIVISPGANGRLGPEDIARHRNLFDNAAVVCLCLEVPEETVLAAAQAGHDAGATVILNLSPFAPISAELAQATDVLLVNEYETAQFLGESEASAVPASHTPQDWQPVLVKFRAAGVPAAIVTLGAQGAMVLDGRTNGSRDAAYASQHDDAASGSAGSVTYVNPTRVTAVDTTGTGDAFFGALAYGLAEGQDLADAATLASKAAAAAATKRGAQDSYVSLDEVNRLSRG